MSARSATTPRRHLVERGASLGGVVICIFADLIVLPVFDDYRRYCGLKVSAILFAIFYAAMALGGCVIEIVFDVAHLTPTVNAAAGAHPRFAWSYTIWIDIGFVAFADVLLWRLLRAGGPAVLNAMGSDGKHAHRS